MSLLLAVVLSSARADLQVMHGATMGTTYHIKLASEPESIDIERLHAEVEGVLAEIDRQMSTYRPDSELSRFNRAAADEWFPVSEETAEVIAAAQAISRKTGGALDVTVGPLVTLWHFGPQKVGRHEATREFKPPDEQQLRAVCRIVGFQQLEVRSGPPALRKQVNGLEVDLSSIAPGHAIDRLAEILLDHDAKNFMIEIGGEIRTAGLRPGGKPWRVAIGRPIAKSREMQSSVPLSNAAIATAGDYQKFFEYKGRRYSHIIDPATGRPIDHKLASVTVVADTCLEADGWDTPLLVLGPERGFECAQQHNIAALFIAHGEQEDVVTTTSAWQQRFSP